MSDELEIPDSPEDVDWENFEDTYSQEQAEKMYDKYHYKNLPPDHKNKMYRISRPDRDTGFPPDDQDYVEIPDGEGGTQRVKRCRAKSSQHGKRCRQPARNGFSVCKMHGAGTKDSPAIQKWRMPIYELRENTELSEKAEKFLNDERFDQIDDEIALQRAMVQKLVEQMMDPESDEVPMKKILHFTKEITKSHKRKKDIESETALTQKELALLVQTIKNSLSQHADPKTQEQVVRDIQEAMS